ncbi:MFS general substrate transporter [Dacryopinax primogenitus]|uniref:MFS general substrate transporter n=1 Tax=Dacryopinax primogenitus (strain DJM 731) TaxID=1858805 RepID=M5GB61_DACPD|nr:MFS general substrate transporter [Dacryopinax primogenitus]EJU03257.1 MFS general substrate transporter [Dacryopinax primogenitus]
MSNPIVPTTTKDDVSIATSPYDESKKSLDVAHLESAPRAHHHTLEEIKELDEAALVLEEAGHVDYSIAEDRRVLRKIDLWVLTPMLIVYFLQQMDKSSVSYASVFNLQAETNLVGTQYAWLTSIVYVAQLVFQPLSSYALVKFPVGKWVLFNVFCWGACVACMGAAKDFGGLLTTRFFLGVFEATVAPSFIAITQMWWRRREQTYRTISWNASNGFASIFGPLIAFGVGHVNNPNILPYQGIFIFLGCLTVALTPVVGYMLPDNPTTARFLKNGNDRVIAIERLRSGNMGTENKTWKWPQFWETMRDVKTWLWALLLFLVACPSGGISAFGGLIVQGFGYDSFTTILFQMPFGGITVLSIAITSWVTNKIKLRFPVIAFMSLFPIAGAVTIRQLPRDNKGGLLAAYYMVSFLGCLQPLLYSWSNLNAAGHTKKVTNTAVLFIAQCVGNIVGPQVYKAEEKPYYYTGIAVDLGCWCALIFAILGTAAYLHYLNKQQEKRRLAAGRPGHVIDTSIMTLEEAEKHRQHQLATGQIELNTNEHAFEDSTDFQNMDFVYVL